MSTLEQIINSKHIVLGKDGFYEFFEYEPNISGERHELVINFCEEVFNIKYIDFSYGNLWDLFKHDYPDDYKNMKKNCIGVGPIIDEDGELAIFSNIYFPCKKGKSYIIRWDDSLLHSTQTKDLLHEISHLIISGFFSKKLDYGYEFYDSAKGLTDNNENIIEGIASALTYVWWRFFGLIKDSDTNELAYYLGENLIKDMPIFIKFLKKHGVLQEDNLPAIALFTKIYDYKDASISDLKSDS